MSKVLVIAPGTNVATVQDITPDLATVQGLVGGLVQPITVGNSVLWCNEEGKLQGLPHNYAADKLLVAAGIALLPGDFICGTAVIQGPSDYDEATDTETHRDVPEGVLEFVNLAGIELQEPAPEAPAAEPAPADPPADPPVTE